MDRCRPRRELRVVSDDLAGGVDGCGGFVGGGTVGGGSLIFPTQKRENWTSDQIRSQIEHQITHQATKLEQIL
jgi:hypothetical protein